MNDNSNKVIDIDINEILPNRFQPRIQFDEEEILELSDSIKEHGVIQPLVVRTIGDKYEIIAGERRYKASVLAGRETVPVIVKNLNDKDSAEIALIENIQRKNLTPIEEAISYKKILDMGYLTQDTLAKKLGKSQSSIANKIRLLNLSDEVQEALLENKISERHARSLLRLKSLKSQNEILEKIINERMPVRRADEEIDKVLKYETANTIKKEEKGEIEMNNESYQSTNPFISTSNSNFVPIMEQPQVGGMMPPIAPEPVVPTVEPIAPIIEQPQMGEMQFGGMVPPIAPEPVVPTVEPITPIMEQPQMGEMQFGGMMPPIAPEPVVPTIEPIAPIMEQPQMGEMMPPIAPEPVVPTVEPIAPIMEQPQMGEMQFGGMVPPIAPEPVVPTVEPITPIMEQPQMGEMQFGGMVSPIAPEPVVPTMEPITPIIEQPQMGEMQFGGMVSPIAPEPVVPTVEPIVEEVPMTEPIIDNTNVTEGNFFNKSLNNIESTIPEPIIVTDFSKQYDPIMPEQNIYIPEKADFREIINAIRECSQKIEKFGYKIDVEEYDLTTLYQVVFKVEK